MHGRCVGRVLCAVLFVIWAGTSAQQTTTGGTGVQSCTTINGYAGQCLPQSECDEEARIDLRTSDTCSKGYHCCATNTLPGGPAKPPATRILECDGGRGYCVLKSECQVRVFRLRTNACATYKEVCCPKESTTVEQVGGMTNGILPAATPTPSVTTWKPSEEIASTPDPELPTTVMGDLDEIIDQHGNGTESEEHATEPLLTSGGTMPPSSSPPESPSTMAASPSPDAGSNSTLVLKPTVSSALFSYTECGQRTANGIAERSLNVLDRTEYGEIPWMAALFAMPQKRYCCNGALISERAVLTTAYCLVLCDRAKDQLRVRLGEWDLNASVEPLAPVDYGVQRVHKHAGFQFTSMINNIAVLELTDHVTYGPTVQPVCLPLPEYSVRSTENILVTGWGATVQPVEAQSTGSNILKTVLLHSIDRTICQKDLRKRHQPGNFRLDESFVCASTQLDERPCSGDAGAPAVIEVPRSDDRYYIHGLVSWGHGCYQNVTVHTVLTGVAHFRKWIAKTLKKIN
ncbi:phenoloxidase-activating factor 2-like [Anopheles bellator]|uniref:phenoloxidase-activating factor 2-like n=1 Tax=Anopheles bellator TaxID=139047 RepID=UPI0026478413|nr:phenoloxidase-activating factor 2-like [Anopheles bellator]